MKLSFTDQCIEWDGVGWRLHWKKIAKESGKERESDVLYPSTLPSALRIALEREIGESDIHDVKELIRLLREVEPKLKADLIALYKEYRKV